MAYFLRKFNRSRGLYLQICESFRSPDKKNAVQKSVLVPGYVCDLQAKGIPDPVAYYSQLVKEMNDARNEILQENKTPKISSVSPVRHLGYFPVKAILNRLDVANPLDTFFSATRSHFSLYSMIEALVFSRLTEPCSKLKTVDEVFPALYGSYSFSYDQTLSALEFMGANYKKIIEIFTNAVMETYILDTSVGYFDCTNFYFEIDREDDFRRKGPSKENRKDPIVGMGLLLDRNCIPIGMSLYPGNQSEKPVIREVIGDLKKQNNIKGRIVQVADKGLNCSQNIITAAEAGDGYLFSKSVKQLPQKEKDWVFAEGKWTEVYDASGQLLYEYKTCIDDFEYSYRDEKTGNKKRKVKEKRVVTYNRKLARKQTREIQKMVEKAKICQLSQAKKAEYGESAKYCKFQSIDENGTLNGEKAVVELDQEKIDQDLRLCGYNLLVTSELNLTPEEIYSTYHQLSRIEESFRCLKSQLEARPVYLQKEERIKGHFLICYLSVLLERLFQFKVLEKKFGSEQVYDFIRKFNVIKDSNGKWQNLSTASKLISFLAEKYNLPIQNYYLTEKQIEKVLNRAL